MDRFCIVCGKPFVYEEPFTEEEYKGKRYSLCCPRCFVEFKKNTKNYTEKQTAESYKKSSCHTQVAKKGKASRKKKVSVYLLSDYSGNLLEHFFSAILTQFPKGQFKIETIPFLKSEKLLLDVIDKIHNGVIFHAVAQPKLKVLISKECVKKKIKSWDVTGPTVSFFEHATGFKAFAAPKPIHTVDSGYLGRMGALEYTMQHDDSRRLDDLGKSDIVIVGISRVSKSPNALFLAYRGFRVTNVSVVPSQGLPVALERHKKKNVVALTIQPKALSEIRHRRFSAWEIKEFQYEDLKSIIHEVMEAEVIYKEKGWPIIDTTSLAVEETSALILSELKLKSRTYG